MVTLNTTEITKYRHVRSRGPYVLVGLWSAQKYLSVSPTPPASQSVITNWNMGVLNWFGVKFAAFNKTWDGWYLFAIMHSAGNCTWTTWWVQYQRDLEDWKALLAWICTTITSLGPSHPPSLSSLISNSCKHTAVWLKLIMVGPLLLDQLIEYKTIATYIHVMSMQAIEQQ